MSYLHLDKIGNEFLNIVLTHPIEYANVLIRIGYEPGPPVIKKTFFGQSIIGLPGLGTYIRHIYDVDGWMGFLPGLTPRLMIGALSLVTIRKVKENFPLLEEERGRSDEECNKNKHIVFFKELTKIVVSSAVSVVVTQPFYVVAVRSMAQFVGRETKYTDVWTSLRIIYTEQGLDGLYAGFLPRLFRNLTNVLIISCASFAIKTYVTKRKDILTASHCLMHLIVRNITYPFQVIATCMAVNDDGLKAGSPPLLPIFDGGWLDCWSYLAETNQLTRGLYPLLRCKKILTDRPTLMTINPVNSVKKDETPDIYNDDSLRVVIDFGKGMSNVNENHFDDDDDDDDDDDLFYDTEENKREWEEDEEIDDNEAGADRAE